MGDQKGFTLIELMTAAALTGMILIIALPFLAMGQKAEHLARRSVEISTEGDAVFEYISAELNEADCVWIGGDKDRPGDGEWNVLYTGDGENGTDRAVKRWKGEPAKFDFSGRTLFEADFLGAANISLRARMVDESGLLLTVRIMENGRVFYEREEVLWTVTIASDSNAQPDGCDAVLWYRKRERSD